MPGLAEIIRLRSVDCRRATPHLATLAAEGEVDADAGSGDPDGHGREAAAAHVAECLRCQAEIAAYRRILRHLRALRHDEVRSPPGALAAVLASLHAAAQEADPGHGGGPKRALRAVYVGGITVATAAATTAGVLVWMSRRRLGLAATG